MKINKEAFSLIELSIVLIIIGLLVAGITGGASLIESAKIRSFINELNGYRQAVYTFRVAKDRLPGDLNRDEKIGVFSNEAYKEGDFAAPYDGKTENSAYGIPNYYSAPFVDLYLEGITDFQPKNTGSSTTSTTLAEKGGIPYSKTLKSFFSYFENGKEDYFASTHVKHGMKENEIYFVSTVIPVNLREDPKIFKFVDEKLDDGIYNNGGVRSGCDGAANLGYNSYDSAIDNKKKCSIFYYKIN